MSINALPTPAAQSLSSLGTLLGPLGTLALVAVLVTLGVLVVGLIGERRVATNGRRGPREVTRAGVSVRHAA